MRPRRLAPTIFALALLAAACGDDDDAAPTTDAAPAADAVAEPVTGPSTIEAIDQRGDGTTVSIAAVELPTDGFVVIHADADGSPGPILGWSELLPAGDSADVVVTLQEPIADSATVFPMAHVDANGNGVYEFMPPDVAIDVPATTAEGGIAVLPISYEVGGTDDGAAADPVLELTSTDLGDILVDGDGNTLYLFTPDAQGDSTCYDDCEANWPILGEVTAVGDGLDESLLGSTTRTNGDPQATYNGWPLYFFAADAAPGDTNGQGVGDVWWVVDAKGDAVGV